MKEGKDIRVKQSLGEEGRGQGKERKRGKKRRRGEEGGKEKRVREKVMFVFTTFCF